MVVDKIIDVIIWLYQNTFLKFFPVEFQFFPIEKFTDILDSFVNNFLIPIQTANQIFPIGDLALALTAIIIAELALFGFKGFTFGANLTRGSGA